MTAIDRTAYPRWGTRLTAEELRAHYSLSDADRAFLLNHALTSSGRLTLAVMLKLREHLGCFPPLAEVHDATIAHLADQLGRSPIAMPLGDVSKPTLYRYRSAIRAHLAVTPFDDAGERIVTEVVRAAAMTTSDPADLIDRAVEALRAAAVDLPAFCVLERLVDHLCGQIHKTIYARVAARIGRTDSEALDGMLAVSPADASPPFDRLKQGAGVPGPGALKLWLDRLDWLGGLPETETILADVTPAQVRQFATEARALGVSELFDRRQPGQRQLLLLSLLQQARICCRDDLIEMFLQHIRHLQAAAKTKLETLQDRHRESEEALIGVFGQVLHTAKDDHDDAALGQKIRGLLAEKGGIEVLTRQYEAGSSWQGDSDLPLLWPIHVKYRSLLFRLFDRVEVRPAAPDRGLAEALALVLQHRHARRDELPGEIDLGFASPRWAAFIVQRRGGQDVVDRRALEVCVFVHLAEALRSGDFHVAGSENFADKRAQLEASISLRQRPIDPSRWQGPYDGVPLQSAGRRVNGSVPVYL